MSASSLSPKRALLYSFFCFFVLTGCSKDDEPSELLSFYAGADRGATIEDLQGIWSVYEVEFEGKKTQVPGNASECPRDFFIFSDQSFAEYTFSDSYGCPPKINATNFELKNGIVRLAAGSQELVVTTVTDQKLVFRTKVKMEEDGSTGTFLFTARPYSPPAEMDIYSETFQHDLISPHYDKIRFSWQPYLGFNQFQRYEIYRAAGDCEKENATLVATITNKEQKFFIDENPPAVEELCYFFRLYTAEGLLAESEIRSVGTDYLQVSSLQMQEPRLEELTVNLSWNRYEGLYFSHYEITIRNYTDGYGANYQEERLTKIDDIDQTTFVHEEAPYISNPVYTVYAYNIFGKRNNEGIYGQNSRTANITRPEILPYKFINQYAVDPEEPVLYLNGRDAASNTQKLQRYNYATHTVEAAADRQPGSYSSLDIKLFRSSYGKELMHPEGSDLYIFDASNLEFKYFLRAESSVHFADFMYLGNNLWAGTDNDHLYTFKREEDKLIILDQQIHFPAHHAYASYYMIQMKDNQILVGHYNEPRAVKYSIDGNGKLQDRIEVPAVITSENRQKTFYSEGQDHLVNFLDHKVYSGKEFSVLQSFDTPVQPTALSSDGNSVLGSANNPSWSVDSNSKHQKLAQTYNIASRQQKAYNTKGYPLFVFENYLGEIMSISSGLKRTSIEAVHFPTPDLFVERVE